MPSRTRRPRLLLSLLLAGMAGIFLADLRIPLGTVIWSFYMIPLVLSASLPRWWAPLAFSIPISALIWLGYLLGPPGMASEASVLFNRLAGIAIAWILAASLAHRERLRELASKRNAELSKLGGLLNAVHDAILIRDVEDRILFWNKAAESHYGWSTSEATGKRSRELLQTGLPEPFHIIMEHVSRDGSWSGELEHRTRDGRAVHVASRWIPWRDGGGRILEIFELNTDITALKHAITEVQAKEKHIRAVIEASLDGVIGMDGDGLVTEWSPQAEAIFGWSRQEVLGRSLAETIIPLRDRDRHQAGLDRFRATGEGRIINRRVELMALRRDGTEFPVELKVSALQHTTALYFIAFVSDISDRVRAREDNRNYVRMQETIAALGLHALSGGNLTSIMDYCTSMIAKMLDLEFSKVLALLPNGELLLCSGVGWREGVVGRATVEGDLDSQAGYTLSRGEPVIVSDLRTETRFNGPPLLHDHGVRSGLSVIIHAQGQSWGVLGAHSSRVRTFSPHEVTFLQSVANVISLAVERDRAHEDLNRSHEQFDLIMKHANDAILYVDLDGVIQWFNRKAKLLLGTSDERLKGRLSTDFATPVTAKLIMERLDAVRHGRPVPDIVELEFARPDKSTIWLEANVTSVTDTARPDVVQGRIILLRDITERKLAQNRLERLYTEVIEGRNRLRTVSLQLLAAQERERAALSRELHDEGGQFMTAILIGLKSLEGSRSMRQMRARAQHIRESAVQSMELLKRLAKGLRPALVEELGLEAALLQLVDEAAKLGGYSIDVHINGVEQVKCPSDIQLAVYRITQEALTNVIRHARARKASVVVSATPATISVIVEDDGRGFDLSRLTGRSDKQGHLGVRGMQERCELLGGEFQIESRPSKGTTVYAKIPLTEA